ADITPDMKLTFYNAGHILGSAIAHIHIGEGLHNVVYTGDIKFGNVKLLEAANTNFNRVETLIIESTYGGKNDVFPPRKEAEERLINLIKETINRKGKVIIPVFAVGRAQEVMVTLAEHKDELNVPVYLDGMISEATAIYATYPEYLNSYMRNKIFNDENPFDSEIFHKVKDREEILTMDDPLVVLSTAGMMTGGPVLEYFKKWCSDERNTLCFVGYQARGSLGRELQEGAKEVKLLDKGIMKSYEVKMQVETIEGFSGHSDKRELLGYLKKINPQPKRILFVHGEKEKVMNMCASTMRFFGIECHAPRNFDGIRLV
ncbi:MAG: MBL fold metallo-hydrolase RNA specificity domain-containing protein, partial [Candidatus Altarchaeaceae archaeon]